MGVIPITRIKEENSSLAFDKSNNIFIPFILKNKYGGCSLVAERTVVVCKTGVRFSPSAFFERIENGGTT